MVLALAPHSLVWLKELVAVAAGTFQMKKNLYNIKFFHWETKTLAKVMESTLEQYCKDSKGNINSKEAICK